MAMWPRVPPTPASKEWTMDESGMPATIGEAERGEKESDERIQL